ncbi:MAG: T9SS type A sorting domain-containing protein [Saprospiraceae bacterium]|nr:T9SS type A sorting domain-containing protein [Saprospiraceae bacterium]
MKKIFQTFLLFILLKGALMAQTVNQISIIPTNPTASDTIFIISDLSYRGNCPFGLVYSYTDVTDSLIQIFPTYCGYWDTTLCNSVDTFKIGPFPNGDYHIRIQYHQGSICPISNFDATIYQVDTSLTVSNTTSVLPDINLRFLLRIYPNPAKTQLTIYSDHFNESHEYHLRITNLLGREIFQSSISQTELTINTTDWKEKGIYFVSIFDEHHNKVSVQKIVIE